MSDTQLIEKVTKFVKAHVAQYNGSHDFAHVLRVHNMALHIADCSGIRNLNITAIKIAALMHNVNNRKYVVGEYDPQLIYKHMIAFGASEQLSHLVNTIIIHISYSYEIQNSHTIDYFNAMQIPECPIVQDANRLDAIGTIGIARIFMYNGAINKSMCDTINHFHEKLYKIPALMKTTLGTLIATTRTQQLFEFETNYNKQIDTNARTTYKNIV